MGAAAGAAAAAWAWALRVRRWTKWYGGQGPEICIWHSRIMALVLAYLFW